MKVSVAYANGRKNAWLKLDVDDACSVNDIIAKSGILERFPDIDLSKQKVGVFGKLVKLDSKVEEGSRIEIYRTITADPETIERKDR